MCFQLIRELFLIHFKRYGGTITYRTVPGPLWNLSWAHVCDTLHPMLMYVLHGMFASIPVLLNNAPKTNLWKYCCRILTQLLWITLPRLTIPTNLWTSCFLSVFQCFWITLLMLNASNTKENQNVSFRGDLPNKNKIGCRKMMYPSRLLLQCFVYYAQPARECMANVGCHLPALMTI